MRGQLAPWRTGGPLPRDGAWDYIRERVHTAAERSIYGAHLCTRAAAKCGWRRGWKRRRGGDLCGLFETMVHLCSSTLVIGVHSRHSGRVLAAHGARCLRPVRFSVARREGGTNVVLSGAEAQWNNPRASRGGRLQGPCLGVIASCIPVHAPTCHRMWNGARWRGEGNRRTRCVLRAADICPCRAR